jgi:hypothetical protein
MPLGGHWAPGEEVSEARARALLQAKMLLKLEGFLPSERQREHKSTSGESSKVCCCWLVITVFLLFIYQTTGNS